MLDNFTLNLEEDKKRIREIVADYLDKHTISDWKYEAALKTLVDKQLVVEPTNNNMETLGEIYLKEALNKYQDRSTSCSTEDKEKIEALQQSIHKICTSTPIKKLLNVARHTSQFLDEAVTIRAQQNREDQQQASQATSNSNFENMTHTERMVFLCEKFGTEGYLDLMEDKIASRYKPYLKETTKNLKLSLQPMTTKNERDMLLKIAECKNKTDIDDLLAIFYANKNMDPLCRYIRLAFSAAAELWSSHLLLNTDHNESWYRTYVYSHVFDYVFMYDDKFTAKRADCYSNITKEFKDVDNQRIDFILRNINDDNDYLSAEEKPTSKGVKTDMKKGKALQKAMLRKWTGHLGSAEIMKQLEAITCQWQGLKLTIYGTRFMSKDHLLTYRKGSFTVPKEETHAASFAHVLAAVLSLRRLVHLNYTKLNIILESKYAHQLETMYFSSEDETNFRSDSTAGLEHQETIQTTDTHTKDYPILDAELETRILQALSNIETEADVVTFEDWEEFIIERVLKKRKEA